MYDEYGWIVHHDRLTGKILDAGDSCFLMSIQAILYGYYYDKAINQGRSLDAAVYKRRALELYQKCYERNFMRHPTINNTSFDMMVGWDYFAARWKWCAPPAFEHRPSAYWSGRHRAPWMYSPFAVMAELLFRIVFPVTGYRFYTSHLLALKAAVCAELHGDLAVLGLFRQWILRIEKKMGYKNAFMRRLALMLIPADALIPWGNNIVEWEYQRNRAFKEIYRRQYTVITHTVFHHEDIPDVENPRPLLFVEQFLEVVNG